MVMSLDMFVCAVRNEDENSFRRDIVERAFTPHVQDVKDEHWTLSLKNRERTWVNMSVDEGDLILGFSINRPPSYDGFPEFWDALYEVLWQTRTYCVLLGARTHPNCCVANAALVDKMPADLVEERGGARLVGSGAELEAVLWD
jgi:hypothetical protein